MLQSLQSIANFFVFDYVPMCQIVPGWKYHVNELIHQQVRAYKRFGQNHAKYAI